MNAPVEFSVSVVAHVCSGAAVLRDRLVAHGLDVAHQARILECRPSTLARATRKGSTPRGLLVGLAALNTVVDELDNRGVALVDLALERTGTADAVDEIGAQHPLATRMLDRLRMIHVETPAAAQLRLPTYPNLAA